MKSSILAVEKVFSQYGLGRAAMPPKIYLDLPEFAGDFRAMPAFVKGLDKCSLKWVNTHANNKKYGLPSVMAVVILNDPKNGFPLSIMDGTLMTSLRTGAAGGVAAKYLARRDSEVVALVGCGVQARTQLLALREVFKIKSVKVWGKESALVNRFIEDMKRPGEEMCSFSTVEKCVNHSDIVVTTTPSRKPIVNHAWIKAGTHINAIGADAAGKQEIDPKIFQYAKLVVDDFRQASHSGEINIPCTKGILNSKDVYAQLGQIVCGKKKGRISDREITIFDSTGLAIQDLAIADVVYRAALKRKKGYTIDLMGLN
ncbi:MAG: alanine dehydrogenase [Candidatus Omnitrophica bacterium]|nr:alanine dehydrogenase [Candidatus Omnitrophota bacterium]